MKTTYKNCDVEIVASRVQSFNPKEPVSFTPVVEVNCKRFGKHTGIATGKSFSSPEAAEQCGVRLAREWIDEVVH